ncbi:MAG: superoxide dismutase [Candidatus Thermofonsia Clade 1 bacterium]|uniref:Superoxide dismutase n=1 Tax=Candidatus Thermofonsia Clade 1 bacterium TaxID=2364210 RepID=A0A2M8PEW9_9CHLR|nr:MAG: superoxide dismutase [Candidatus Thermofonsia Clade 1 bacterium]RMF52932.1 MAG: superoxide dismutase [Chloroflexota bacterium]
MPKFELPPLPYPSNALEPHIDAQTMEIHHGKHHAAYVNNLNAALEKYPQFFEMTPEQIIKDLASVPEEVRQAVRNNGGGHVNHTMFWQIMSANGGGAPTGDLAAAIDAAFGSFENFKAEFKKAALGRFGSGWAWLIVDNGALKIVSTPNQDNPIMDQPHVVPILGLDVWEHAYYLKYQNRRPDYVDAWWNVVDWNAVAARYAAAK